MKSLICILLVMLAAGSGEAQARRQKRHNRATADNVNADRARALQRLSVADLDSLIDVTTDTLPDVEHAPAPVTPLPSEAKAEAVTIMGEAVADLQRMTDFVRRRNPDFDPAIAEAFLTVGARYGIRGDIALCQSILETGWFRFGGGTAVRPEQHNYCGLGVTRLGVTGASFESIEDGVTAQIQHLYAYACRRPLPEGERLLDPRFRMVERGIAPTWEGLNRRWAANDHYSQRILSLYEQMMK